MTTNGFSNKAVIVTGGAKGIGAAVVKAFANAGATVIIADILEERGRELSHELEKKGKPVFFVGCDIRQPDQVAKMVEKANEISSRIDILINNAGISFPKPITELSIEEWDNVLNTNLRGAFLCSKEAVPFMKKHGGKIINIASTRAFMSEPDWEAYGASKGGLVALTHAMAISLGQFNIQVNCISPGWIMTGDYEELRLEDHQQHPAGRVGKPEDIASACLFLADSQNGFITGENLIIDGGISRKMIYEE
jgi:NAD(P)-dependent dehydrogenase (short-subunit alcohol dehydrogenase family)